MKRRMKNRLNDDEITLRGIDALNECLGAVDALRFLSLAHRPMTDYVKVSHRLYKDQTVDEIFARAKKQWKKKALSNVNN
jgi:hypothetical protein